MYPLHRVGGLLSLEESSTSCILTEALAGLRKEGQPRDKDDKEKEEVMETNADDLPREMVSIADGTCFVMIFSIRTTILAVSAH